MNDDIQQPAEPEASKTPFLSTVKNNIIGGSLWTKIFAGIMPLVAATAFVVGLAIYFAMIVHREPAPNTTALASGTHCASWSAAPAGYQKAIENAANTFARVGDKVPIQSALLGAIFKSENGDNWKDKAITDTNWAQGGNGVGPFQLENWENKWRTVTQLGLTGSPPREGNPQKFDDAALMAGGVLYEVARDADIPLNTIDENEIKCLAAGYNGGPAMCKNWKAKNYDPADPPATTNKYHERAWTSFQELNQGCVGYAPNVNNLIAGSYSNPKWDKSYMARPVLSAWLTDRKKNANKKLVPTGWTLHWTGGSSPEGAYGGMSGRDPKVFVHFMIDYDGTVYQLMPLNLKQAGSGTGEGKDAKGNTVSANDFTLGIEIVGVGETDLERADHKDQKDAVVNLIKEVDKALNMPKPLQGNKANFEAKVGIFGHFQTGGGTCTTDASGKKVCDYEIGCTSTRKTDPGKKYLKEIWDLVGADDGTGCIK